MGLKQDADEFPVFVLADGGGIKACWLSRSSPAFLRWAAACSLANTWSGSAPALRQTGDTEGLHNAASRRAIYTLYLTHK
jgi:hypothetical protein